MKSSWPIMVALMAATLVTLSGCRTAGVNDLARQDRIIPRPKQDVAELLSEHNANAERVKSLEAKPTVMSDRRIKGALSGRLALEGRRNFKLQLYNTFTGDYADIGSNDREFWFWVKDAPEKAVFFCNYDESGASPLAASLQPDWIVEALGLHVVNEEEIAATEVTKGQEAGTLLLTRRQKTPQGETFVKKTILSESTHKILEHRVYESDGKKLLARAALSEYQDFGLGKAGDDGVEKAYLPKRIRLEWIQEKLALQVVMKDVKVNTEFNPTRRQALFIEPEGFARVNLAERTAAGSAPTSVRETMPAPPPSRVRLDGPKPLGARTPLEPMDQTARLNRSEAAEAEQVVGPPIPTIGEPYPATVQSWNGWRTAMAPGIEH
jgi:hypothetical protein